MAGSARVLLRLDARGWRASLLEQDCYIPCPDHMVADGTQSGGLPLQWLALEAAWAGGGRQSEQGVWPVRAGSHGPLMLRFCLRRRHRAALTRCVAQPRAGSQLAISGCHVGAPKSGSPTD
jgi:hypothetical protein